MERFANNAQSTLGAGIDASVTSLTVASAALFPTAGNFRILVDSELMIVTAVSGTTFTVTRGAEGTAAASHSSGAAVTHTVTAGAMSAIRGWALIAATTLGSDAASIVFTSIPQTYAELEAVFVGRSAVAATTDTLLARLNGDSTAIYDWQYLYGYGGAVGTGFFGNQTSGRVCDLTGNTATAGLVATASLRIPRYAATDFHKSMRSDYSTAWGTTSATFMRGINHLSWKNTAAVNSITLFAGSASLKAASFAALYGRV